MPPLAAPARAAHIAFVSQAMGQRQPARARHVPLGPTLANMPTTLLPNKHEASMTLQL